MYDKAKVTDANKSERFYKLAKYSKEHQDNERDPLVNKFKVVDGFQPDMIEIPEEFKNLKIEDIEQEVADGKFTEGARKNRRKIQRNRTDKNLKGYDAWRVTDRKFLKGDGKAVAVAKIMISPAALIRTFGDPDSTEIFYSGTGQFDFEDGNLDLFCLYDYR
jgi:hypothetical protein